MAEKKVMTCDGIADGIDCERTVVISEGPKSRDYWSQAPDKKWIRIEVRSSDDRGVKTFCSWGCVVGWAASNDRQA